MQWIKIISMAYCVVVLEYVNTSGLYQADFMFNCWRINILQYNHVNWTSEARIRFEDANVLTQVASHMIQRPREQGHTVIPSAHFLSPRSRLDGSSMTVSWLQKGHVERHSLWRNREEFALRWSGTTKGACRMRPPSSHVCIDEEYKQWVRRGERRRECRCRLKCRLCCLWRSSARRPTQDAKPP